MAKKKKNPEDCGLAELCNFVVTMKYAYEDVSEYIEERAYEMVQSDELQKAVDQIRHIALAFEAMEYKNDENCRDLADVYILLGELYQCAGKYNESLSWFEKAILVDDRYDVPYHRMAGSYRALNQPAKAIRCIKQEIRIQPGNYFSYLLLADLYREIGDYEGFESILEELLERDQGNVSALHRLITHYEETNPKVDVEFLRRRLITTDTPLEKQDLLIWVYHMSRKERYGEALRELETQVNEGWNDGIQHLMSAHLLFESDDADRARAALADFVALCGERKDTVRRKLEQFEHVFGTESAARIRRFLYDSFSMSA